MAEAKNERLWFKTNMKLANLWVGLKEAGKAAKVGRVGCVGGQGAVKGQPRESMNVGSFEAGTT